MHSIIFGILVISALACAGVVGMLIVRKYVHIETLRSYHEVAGYMLSMVGTLYAVLLGFVVVDAMHHVQEVRQLVSAEASGLASIFLGADGLPTEQRVAIRLLCHQYAYDVITDEWPCLRRRVYSAKTFHDAFKLWKEIGQLNPKNSREQDIHQQLLLEVSTMTENHRARVVSAVHGVPTMLWVVLIIGGALTVLFTYFFGVENLKVQSVMTSFLVVILSLNLYLVYLFGNPMANSPVNVVPESMQI